jgi:UMF1 family MFS transporter
MAAICGAEIGIGDGALVGSILLVQFVGIPFAVLFGMLADRLGAKRAIYLGLAGYTGIAIFAYFMTAAWHFLVLALGVAAVQGGTQALSRSLFASLIPKHKSAEFFSFFAVGERFAGILGPALFAATTALTGSSRYAIVSVILFFIVGGVLLSRVDADRGRRAAIAVSGSFLTTEC